MNGCSRSTGQKIPEITSCGSEQNRNPLNYRSKSASSDGSAIHSGKTTQRLASKLSGGIPKDRGEEAAQRTHGEDRWKKS